MPEQGSVRWGRAGAIVGAALLAGVAWNAFDDDDDVRAEDAEHARIVADLDDGEIDEISEVVENFVGERAAERVRSRLREEREQAQDVQEGGVSPEEREAFDDAFDEAREAVAEAREEVREALEDSNLSSSEKERVLRQLEL